MLGMHMCQYGFTQHSTWTHMEKALTSRLLLSPRPPSHTCAAHLNPGASRRIAQHLWHGEGAADDEARAAHTKEEAHAPDVGLVLPLEEGAVPERIRLVHVQPGRELLRPRSSL